MDSAAQSWPLHSTPFEPGSLLVKPPCTMENAWSPKRPKPPYLQARIPKRFKDGVQEGEGGPRPRRSLLARKGLWSLETPPDPGHMEYSPFALRIQEIWQKSETPPLETQETLRGPVRHLPHFPIPPGRVASIVGASLGRLQTVRALGFQGAMRGFGELGGALARKKAKSSAKAGAPAKTHPGRIRGVRNGRLRVSRSGGGGSGYGAWGPPHILSVPRA